MFFKLDDQMNEWPEVRRLGKDRAAAMGVLTLAGIWASGPLREEADGFVPASMLRQFGDTARGKYAQALVDADLWVAGEHDGEAGFWFGEKVWQYQVTAEEKRARRVELEARRARENAGSAERMRRMRARRAAGSDASSGRKVSDFSREVGARSDVTAATQDALTDADYTPSDLDVSDSMTERSGQRYVDRDASRDAVTGSISLIPSSGDLGGGVAVGDVRAKNAPTPQDQLEEAPTTAGIAARAAAQPAAGPRPDDADRKICDLHWHLRYGDVWESIPDCRLCRTRRQQVEQADAAAGRAEAARIAERRRAMDACSDCEGTGMRTVPPLTPTGQAAVVRCSCRTARHLAVVAG